jgi:hypothetical protein
MSTQLNTKVKDIQGYIRPYERKEEKTTKWFRLIRPCVLRTQQTLQINNYTAVQTRNFSTCVKQYLTLRKEVAPNLRKWTSVPRISSCKNPYVKQLVTEITA